MEKSIINGWYDNLHFVLKKLLLAWKVQLFFIFDMFTDPFNFFSNLFYGKN